MGIRLCFGRRGLRFFICVFAVLECLSLESSAVIVLWEPNLEPDIAGYRLYYGEVNAPATVREIRDETRAAISGLVQGRQYYFYLTAFDTENLESDPSESVFYTEPVTVPTSPANLAGVARSASEIQLTWNDTSTNETGFRLLRKAGIIGSYTTLLLGPGATSFTDRGLASGTLYFYKIQSFNGAGSSLFSPGISTATGLLPGEDPNPGGSGATFVRTDTETRGDWIGSYGAEGAVAPYSDFLFPTVAQINANYNYPLVLESTSTDPAALQRRLVASRFATCWRHTNDFYFYLQFKDTAEHQVAFYFADFQDSGGEQRLEISDYTSGKVLGGTNISNFGNGVYSVWNIQGKVTVRLSRITGSQASMSGIFIDPPAVPPNEVEFIGFNSTNSGTWLRHFGREGHSIASEIPLLPPNVELTVSGASAVVWASGTSDPRALQRPYTRGRIASGWQSSSPFTFELEWNDAEVHRVSLYALDWEGFGRRELIEILDGQTGAVLDSTEISNFGNGLWLHYDMRGHLVVRVWTSARATGVLSGIFFD